MTRGAPKTRGHTAVMSKRATPETIGEGADEQSVLDYFPTPPWAARAGGELVRSLDPNLAAVCSEPACGEGHMAHGLADYFASVECSDIADYGAGAVRDFLAPQDETGPAPDWIITNPPFVEGAAFARLAYRRAARGVALLLRLAFLEGIERHDLFTRECPLTLVAAFAERVPMVKGRYDPKASSATAYAWFVWDKLAPPGPPRVAWIPPGTKARLIRATDLERFAGGLSQPGLI